MYICSQKVREAKLIYIRTHVTYYVLCDMNIYIYIHIYTHRDMSIRIHIYIHRECI